MGTVPNRWPLALTEISAGLGGENNLGYYRGRQYWYEPDGSPRTISQSPSFAEFPGLTNVQPAYLTAIMVSHLYTVSTIPANRICGYSQGSMGSLTPKNVGGILPGTTANSVVSGIWAECGQGGTNQVNLTLRIVSMADRNNKTPFRALLVNGDELTLATASFTSSATGAANCSWTWATLPKPLPINGASFEVKFLP